MRHRNPSNIHDLFESCAILIESCTNIELMNEIEGILGDLVHECEAVAFAVRYDNAVYDIYHLDVWGNEENGFEVNQQYRVGEVFLPEIKDRNGITYTGARLDELIYDENLAAVEGIAWEDRDGSIEIRDGTGRPWITLIERNLAPDVERVITERPVSAMVKNVMKTSDGKQFVDMFRDLTELVMATYESDDSGHEFIRLRTWIARLSRAAHYKMLILNSENEPQTSEHEVWRWKNWLIASLSPEGVDEVISDAIEHFENTCSQVNFSMIGDHLEVNQAFMKVEVALFGLVRQ